MSFTTQDVLFVVGGVVSILLMVIGYFWRQSGKLEREAAEKAVGAVNERLLRMELGMEEAVYVSDLTDIRKALEQHSGDLLVVLQRTAAIEARMPNGELKEIQRAVGRLEAMATGAFSHVRDCTDSRAVLNDRLSRLEGVVERRMHARETTHREGEGE